MEDLKKVVWFNSPVVLNENFEIIEKAIEEIEVTQVEPAAAVTTFSGVANLPAVPGTFADVAAVKTYMDTLVPAIENRLDAIESKINSLITGFRASGAITQ